MKKINYDKSSGEISILIDNEIKTILIEDHGENTENFILEYILKNNIKEGDVFYLEEIFNNVTLLKLNCNLVYKKTKSLLHTKIKHSTKQINNVLKTGILQSNQLNYFYDYYPKNNIYFNEQSKELLDIFKGTNYNNNKYIKDLKNNNFHMFFEKIISRLINEKQEKIILVVVPGHKDLNVISNTITRFIKFSVKKKPKILIDGSQLILRKHEVIKSSKNVKPRSVDYQFQSLKLNKIINIEDKVILLIDDFYTTGSSIKACKKILEQNGAKQVYLFTFAKTIFFGGGL